MPDHKNQHFVPRCHLKPFSAESAGKAINLLHLKSGRLIQNAPVKSQCAKEYFYGEDLSIEKWLQGIEGQYSSVVREIIECDAVNEGAEEILRNFSFLQYLRTDIAIRRTMLAQQAMESLIFEDTPNDERPKSLSKKELVETAIRIFSETGFHVGDLKVCILRNETPTSFVTSDDPSVLVNRFYAQRLGPRWGAAGIRNAGTMLVLPISPRFCVCCYDGDVYTCADRVGRVVPVNSEADIRALNTLQYLKASEAIYFFDWCSGSSVKADFDAVAAKRPNGWHAVHYAVKDEAQACEGSIRFRVVHSADERFAAKEALIHLEMPILNPGVWCSKIKFRPKPLFVDTRSGAGFVRRSRVGLLP